MNLGIVSMYNALSLIAACAPMTINKRNVCPVALLPAVPGIYSPILFPFKCLFSWKNFPVRFCTIYCRPVTGTLQYHLTIIIPAMNKLLYMIMGLLFSAPVLGQDKTAAAAIAASNATYFSAFEKGDSSIFINCYASDACILAPDMQPVCGPAGILSFFQKGYYEYGLRSGKFITKDIYGSGDYVTEYGLYESRDAKGNLIGTGKYLVLWKKTDKGWKMFRDSFSSDH